MEAWFTKAVIATLTIVPTFLAIPLLKTRYGVDTLVYVVWYFGATAVSMALFFTLSGRAAALLPPAGVLAAIIAIGLVCGATANGLLFQSVGLAPNPGLPPVIYACSSIVVFGLSVALASSFPSIFRPVSADPARLAGIVLVIVGLYLMAGGRVPWR